MRRGEDEKRRRGEEGERWINGTTYLAMTAINLVDVRLSTRHILPSARVKKPIFPIRRSIPHQSASIIYIILHTLRKGI